MFNLNSIKVSRLPKSTKFFEASDGYFEINEDMEIRMFANRDVDEIKIMELQQEIQETERQLENPSLPREELEELKSKLYSLESEYRYESETIRKLPYVCKFVEQESYLLDQWKLYAKDAKQNTVRSIARATGWRSVNSEIREDDILPEKWSWNYTWSKKA